MFLIDSLSGLVNIYFFYSDKFLMKQSNPKRINRFAIWKGLFLFFFKYEKTDILIRLMDVETGLKNSSLYPRVYHLNVSRFRFERDSDFYQYPLGGSEFRQLHCRIIFEYFYTPLWKIIPSFNTISLFCTQIFVAIIKS